MDAKIGLADGDEIRINAESVKANNMKLCHSHSCYELYYLTEGERYLYAENRFYKMRRGDISLMPPGIMHRTLDSEKSDYSKFVVMLPKSLIPKSSASEFRIVRPSDDFSAELLRCVRSVSAANVIDGYSAILRLLNAVLTLPIYNEETVSSPVIGRVGEILNYLDEHYTEKITLTSLSERFYISEYYLCRLFKEYTGRTLNEYISHLRVEKAKLLLSDRVSVSRAWKMAGFGSESSFNRIFRERVGCSAREWKSKKV
ncbi:MAG: helix-turn-helix transcriptional regulator [Clostridia bacterium]|nr:helix-turn-helix transcriptional regulator [Clostridia bacterium]